MCLSGIHISNFAYMCESTMQGVAQYTNRMREKGEDEAL